MDLSVNNENLEEKNGDETASNYGEDNNSAETSPENLEKVKSEEQKMKFTKVRNICEKNKLHEKRCQLPRGEDECKRRKNQKDEMIPKKKPMSRDSQVNQILVDCGVQHTYSNTSRIGTSKAEKEMTSRAMKEVFELGQFSQQPANCFVAIESNSEESDDIGDYSEGTTVAVKEDELNRDATMTDKSSDDSISSATNRVQREMSVTKAGNSSVLFGETPRAIRLRQFTEISQTQGYESAVDLAKAVVSCNTTDRLNLLEGYYKTKHYPVDTIITRYSGEVESSPETNTDNSKTLKRSLKSESSLKLSRARHRSSSKSYTKIFKTPVVKTHKEDGTGESKDCTKRITPAPSSSLRNSCTDIPDKAENENITTESLGDTTESDKSLKKTKSPSAATKHACTGIPSELRIAQTKSEDNIIKSLDGQLEATHGAADFSTKMSLSAETVLDEFLCESSQTTSTRLKADESSENVVPHFAGKVSHRKLQKQASILDDLI